MTRSEMPRSETPRSETLAETMLLTRDGTVQKLRLRFVALVVAVAVAMGVLATAGPARADNDDLAKALAALAVVGIIAHSVQKNRPRQDEYRSYPPQPLPEPQHHRSRKPWVPAVCGIEIAGQQSRATVYGERCLREQGFDWRLPERCARPARIYGRNDRIYSEHCLRDAGFRIGRHRN